jgi:preprotein translocase subunit SecF
MRWGTRIPEMQPTVQVLIIESMFLRGALNYGIDFTRRTLLEVRFSKPTSVAEIRAALHSPGLRSPTAFGRAGGIAEKPFPRSSIDRSMRRFPERSSTAGTRVLTTTALFLLGGPVIHSFAFALLVGFVIGTYSSIFVSTSIVLYSKRADAA